MERANRQSSNLANVIAYALIGAISFVVMKLEIPIMPGVEFLKFDFSDVIITIGMFIFGALPGIFIAFIRSFLSLMFSGFNPMSIIGQIAAFLASISFALPFYLFSKNVTKANKKSLKGRLIPILGLGLGIILMTVILSLLNAFVLTPVYAMLSVPNLPAIHNYHELFIFTEKVYLGQFLHLPSMNAYIFGIIIPFNLLKGAINSVVVYLLFEATLKNIKPFVRRKFNIKN